MARSNYNATRYPTTVIVSQMLEAKNDKQSQKEWIISNDGTVRPSTDICCRSRHSDYKLTTKQTNAWGKPAVEMGKIFLANSSNWLIWKLRGDIFLSSPLLKQCSFWHHFLKHVKLFTYLYTTICCKSRVATGTLTAFILVRGHQLLTYLRERLAELCTMASYTKPL